ncbi:VanZ family protein [Delftia sp. PS-11]|uniref:VanZ family protein n=1 Tax=Delftia sp. PS-11 TaxID=2767222 RepID=UPI0024553459|nr:VanZ family protein [Delftia sp. PS-11]KAJ8746086.1 VanZ family protein [Delftia sp. PS-11]
MAYKTSAWPLALVYAALIVFASLFPFDGWRAQGIDPLVFLTARIPPPYWTWFDVNTNVAGYAPLGFLLALALMRSGMPCMAVPLAALAGVLLSLVMEFLQIYLPQRVPSNLDLTLNAGGALLGALLALLLERLGAVARWDAFRSHWLGDDGGGALALLALWPFALLFPAAVPFGLGQVLERLEQALQDLLEGTPFLAWLPQGDPGMTPLSPVTEMLCVMLGLWAPCLLAYCVMRHTGRRAVLAMLTILAGVGVSALSAALSWGPAHAWEWVDLPVRMGVWGGLGLSMVALPLPRRACAALLLLALMLNLSILNQAPTSAYFSETLQAWEQGRFIRFYGLGQWLGWLWPYATLAYVVLRVAQRQTMGDTA